MPESSISGLRPAEPVFLWKEDVDHSVKSGEPPTGQQILFVCTSRGDIGECQEL